MASAYDALRRRPQQSSPSAHFVPLEMIRRLEGRLGEMIRRLEGRLGKMIRRLEGRLGEMIRRLEGRLGEPSGGAQYLHCLVQCGHTDDPHLGVPGGGS